MTRNFVELRGILDLLIDRSLKKEQSAYNRFATNNIRRILQAWRISFMCNVGKNYASIYATGLINEVLDCFIFIKNY